MPSASCRFRKREIARAIKAAEAAGKAIKSCRLTPTGDIVLEFEGDRQPEAEKPPEKQWPIA